MLKSAKEVPRGGHPYCREHLVNQNYRQRKIGQLNVIEKPGSSDGPWIIIFHGFGADASDLASFAQAIDAPKDVNWLFPDGPLEVPIGPHTMGRAWFPIDMAEIEKAMMAGTHRDMSELTPPGLETSRDLVLEMIAELGLSMEKILLGGFSQGAMLTTDIALRSEISPKGIALLSGTLLNQDIWKGFAEKKKGLKFFQSHGTSDPVLGFPQAQKLNSLLTNAGLRGDFIEFAGGHEIPPQVMKGFSDFISKTL